MSFTRFYDDPARVHNQNDRLTHTFRYQLDTPGPGVQLPFLEDPQIRMQKWGANMWSDSTNLESDLMGLGRPLNHDYDRTYHDSSVPKRGYAISFPVMAGAQVDESRTTHPAWMYKDIEQTRWETPILNPQNLKTVMREFDHNVQSRILAKDHWRPVLPNIQ